jgi:hypothetical protein
VCVRGHYTPVAADGLSAELAISVHFFLREMNAAVGQLACVYRSPNKTASYRKPARVNRASISAWS